MNEKVIISIIAAVDEEMGMGKNNQIPWHLSDDLRRFKKITMGHCVIMGRNTYESLPVKPLPGRTNMVLTSQRQLSFKGCITADSVQDALDACRDAGEIFIIGGARVYEDFLPFADKIYLTRLRGTFGADRFFPAIKASDWMKKESGPWETDSQTGQVYCYEMYCRTKKQPPCVQV